MPRVTDKDTLDALESIARDTLGEGAVVVHASRPTTKADWDTLNPNSLETDCRDCGAYYTMEWAEDEGHPEQLTCPDCGSHNHGSVGSPAGAMSLAMHDPTFD